MKLVKRTAIVGVLLAGLSAPAPALAFHHVFVPGDDCATVGNLAGDNPIAHAAVDKQNTLPIAPAGNPDQAPDESCPAPTK